MAINNWLLLHRLQPQKFMIGYNIKFVFSHVMLFTEF